MEVIHRLVDSSLDGVRRLSHNLRPAILEDLGLLAALRAHVEELAQLGLHVELVIIGDEPPRRIQPEVAYAVYRVAQEALSNAAPWLCVVA